MREFKLNRDIKVYCENYQTSCTWGHKGFIEVKGIETNKAKIRYINRTWEKFEYQSLIYELVNNCNVITDKQKLKLKEVIKNVL